MTKVDWEYEEKCEQSYEEVCHGYGYEKKCDQVPKEMCHQVPVKVEKQVTTFLELKHCVLPWCVRITVCTLSKRCFPFFLPSPL